ncbi:hypothetical protein ACFWIA_19885 [Streptomyces sp. NPDC127068]
MSRIALLEPPCTDQVGALLARTMRGWGRYELDSQATPLAGGRHA